RGRPETAWGTGGRHRMFTAFRVDPTSLVARFNEGLRVMKALWTEPRVSFDGRFWQLKDAAMEPKPFQKPHPPIWFGASHPDALRRAVRYGNGFFGAGSSTTKQFAAHVPIVRQSLAEAGRDAASFKIGKRVYIAVDDDGQRARRRIGETLHRIYPFFELSGLEAVAVYGPPDACVRRLREVTDAGAELILLNPVFDEAEQMERLAAAVVPKLS